MPEAVECVINISEGRDLGKVGRISRRVDSNREAWLLGIHSDGDHNRSVLTIFGTPEGTLNAACSIFESALEEIDLQAHEGIHPRIGAVDVVPFVPVRCSMQRCVELARSFGKWAANHASVPVFFYENAAIIPERRNLADIRRGGVEGLQGRIGCDPGWRPDLGPTRIHPTAGAVVVGAREFLIAFNVFLDSQDRDFARRIARKIRESSGGLPFVRALGLFLDRRGVIQISMNLTDFRQTSLFVVFEEIRLEAESEGVAVLESEVVGYLPQEALLAGDVELLKIRDFGPELILENRIEEVTGWRL